MKTASDAVEVLVSAGWSSEEINIVLSLNSSPTVLPVPAVLSVPDVQPVRLTWQPLEQRALYDVYDT